MIETTLIIFELKNNSSEFSIRISISGSFAFSLGVCVFFLGDSYAPYHFISSVQCSSLEKTITIAQHFYLSQRCALRVLAISLASDLMDASLVHSSANFVLRGNLPSIQGVLEIFYFSWFNQLKRLMSLKILTRGHSWLGKIKYYPRNFQWIQRKLGTERIRTNLQLF